MRTAVIAPALVFVACSSPPAVELAQVDIPREVLRPARSASISVLLDPPHAPHATGTLVHGEEVLARFSAATLESWTAEVAWAALARAAASEDPKSKIAVSRLQVRFTVGDQLLTRDVELQVACANDNQALCGGVCVDATTDAVCGTCGVACGQAILGGSLTVHCGRSSLQGTPHCGAVTPFLERKSCRELCSTVNVEGAPLNCMAACWIDSSAFPAHRFNGGITAGRAAWSSSLGPSFTQTLDSCDTVPVTTDSRYAFSSIDCCCGR